MTGRRNDIPPIPRETARNAKAVFGGDNFYIRVGEQLESIVAGIRFEDLSTNGESDAFLPLVTFFQAVEGLVDAQAVNAVRSRIDWKYALHMSVHAPVLHERDLCEFRFRMMPEPLRQDNFQKLIDRLLLLEPPIHKRLQGIKSEEVLSTVCSINQIASLHEAIHQAVEVLAVRYPEWLQKIVLPHWYGRYTGLSIPWIGDEQSLMDQGIADINYLFERMQRSGSPEILELEEIETLDQVRTQYFQKRSQAPPDENESLGFHHCNACMHKVAIRRR